MIPPPRTLIKKFCRKLVAIGSPNDIVCHFTRCIEFIGYNGIEGDLLEFGVFRGGSLIVLDQISRNILRKRLNMNIRIFGFDSFQGLPEPKGIDKDSKKNRLNFRQGRYRCTKEEVLRRLKEHRADLDHIQLIEGWYDQILTPELRQQLQINKASFINIDCDLYQSAITVLNWCEPLIDQGTVINFDDWFCYQGSSERGLQRAFHEFLDSHPELTTSSFSTCGWYGKAFIL